MTLILGYKLQHKNHGFQNEAYDQWKLQIQNIEHMTQMTTSFLEHMIIDHMFKTYDHYILRSYNKSHFRESWSELNIWPKSDS
jgi:hypothetical protein